MGIFVSYSSADEALVKELAQGFEMARQEVWFDHDLGGGEVWWVKILENIRKADVFVVALSDRSLVSKPCKAELEYAQALDRVILPVKVGHVTNFRMNPLSTLQTIEFRTDDARSVFEIMGAIDQAARQARPLPDPLPPEPPLPYAYLISLNKQIQAEELGQQAQIDAVDQLRKAYREEIDPTVQDDIVSTLRQLRAKPWVTNATVQEADAALGWIGDLRRVGSGTSTSAPAKEAPREHDVQREDRERRQAFERSIVDALEQQQRRSAAAGSASSVDQPGAGPTARSPEPPPPAAARFPGVRRPAGGSPRQDAPASTPPTAAAGAAAGAGQQPRTSPRPAPGPAPRPAPPVRPPRPWWGLTVPSLLVLPIGLVGLYFSVQVGQRRARGDLAGARHASTYALTWGLIGVVVLLVLLLAQLGG